MKEVKRENSLAVTHPELVKEWHPTKNGDLTPYDFTYGSRCQKIWWICKCGHEWEETIVSRTSKKTGCPYCSGHRVWQGFNDLATTHPELAKQWHPTKNSDVKPVDVSSGSSFNAWWVCEHGHEWRALISTRTVGNSGCPYCCGRVPIIGTNDLLTTHPHIAKWWHPTKNKTLKPTDVSAGSGKSVHWICEHGHEWKSVVRDLVKTQSCPICCNRKLLTGFNDLATTHPEIAKQWHPTKNSTLKPTQVIAKGHQKIWWQCEFGHEWEATLISRKNGTNCPYCSSSGMSVPEIAILYEIKKYINQPVKHRCKDMGFELDLYIPSLKIGIEYDGVFYHKDKIEKDIEKNILCEQNNVKLYRIRENGLPNLNSTSIDIYCKPNNNKSLAKAISFIISETLDYVPKINLDADQSDINSLLATQKKENSLAVTHPEIAKQWHPTKNNVLTPEQITIGSGRKVWWKCEHGHEWQAAPSNRLRAGCPYCANKKVLTNYNDLPTTHPHIAKWWHPTKNGNLKPEMFTFGTNKKVWWKCEHGHEWQASVSYFVANYKCPYCSGRKVWQGFNDLATTHPEIAKQWHPIKNGKLKPTDVTAGSGKKVWWKCEHDHEWQVSIVSRTSNKTGCPYCSGKKVCRGFNDLATTHPEIAKQWHPIKNGKLKPTDVTAGSRKKVWWIGTNGNVTQSHICDKTRKPRIRHRKVV